MSRTYTIAVLPGDGIGPEVTEQAIRVLEAAARPFGLSLALERFDASAALYRRAGVTMPETVFESCRAADAIILGAIGLPEVRHADGTEVAGDAIFRLRFGLDLYAGLRPVKLYAGAPSPLRDPGPGIDYVVVRENVEGLYASRGGGCSVRDDVVVDSLVVTREGTRKVVDAAFRLAASRKGRPRDGQRIVTCVDKSNVLRSYAFFRKVFDDTAAAYPGIGRDYAYVDAMTAYQVLRPWDYDVVVAENMFGDIISDLAAATVGGLGMAPSADVGDAHGLFQPAHGSAPDIAGRNRANPAATILSAAMMLAWLSDRHADDAARAAAVAIEAAAAAAIADGSARTPDLGGAAGTAEAGAAVAARAAR
jgi:3-isopropylmalate dehydrogenase